MLGRYERFPKKAWTQGERVASWLKKRFERDVRPVVVGDYQALVDAIADGEVDFAWMPPISFVRAAERGVGVVALAQRYGRPTYEAAIIVREDSPFGQLADLRGRSIAYVDRDSASGYLFAADLIGRKLGRPSEVLGARSDFCDGCLNMMAWRGRLIPSCRLDDYRVYGTAIVPVSRKEA